MNLRDSVGWQLAGPDADPPTRWSYWIIEHRLLAGAYPGSPDPAEHRQRVQALLDAGIRAFINLMEGDETNYAGEPFVPYDGLARKLCPEARFHRYPVRDLTVPSRADMAAILTAIDHSLGSNRPTYVHCWGGVGRTGTVIGCWLLQHRLADPTNVLDVLQGLRQRDWERGHRMSPETPEQQQFVTQWLARQTVE